MKKLVIFIVALLISAYASLVCSDSYRENGIVVSEEPWDEFDYLQLKDLVKEYEVRLPRLHNSNSAQVFRKMISDTNLSILEDPKVSIEDKVLFGMSLDQTITEFSEIYLNAHSLGKYDYESELAQLFAFTVRLAFKGNNIIEEYLKTNKDNNIGASEMKEGKSQMLASLVDLAGRQNAYSNASLILLSETLVNVVEKFIKDADKKSTIHLESELKKTIKKIRSSVVKKNLENTLKIVSTYNKHS